MKKLFKISITVLLAILTVCSFPLAANAETLDVGNPVEEYPELFLTRTLPAQGEGRVLVFLIQFPDMQNDSSYATAEYFNELYFKAEPFSKNPTNTFGYSVSGFYEQESYGKLKLTGEVLGWYTAKHERAYYDNKKLELIEEAAQYYIAKGEDLSEFDADNDGVIDALVFHFAGEASANQDDPWYGGTNYESNGTHSIACKKIGRYIQVHSEVSKSNNSLDLRKTACHELMHSLGLFDLYGKVWNMLDATDDLMSKNDADINPYYKMLLGWTEKVTVVTSSVSDIRLNDWLKTGEALLVTDSFNGIFDEFYMITYKEVKQSASKDGTTSAENPNQIRIWHIDARPNESKTSFLYNNLAYSAEPEKGDIHGKYSKVSEYLFIEELSSVPACDRVINKSTADLYFREGSSLGPNTIPNTDTHNGRYTGIRIDDFKRYSDHATMDITLEKQDTTAPRVSEELSNIGVSGENKLRFDQNIYVSDNWSAIKVTDLNGKELAAEIKKSHYPAHEIDIKITSDIPKEGFKIVLPAGCVADSSGNKNEAEVIVFDRSQYVNVESKTFIPWYYENKARMWEGDPICFAYGDERIIITPTGEGSMKGMTKFIEFIKTDAEGNITAHEFFINPEPDSMWINAVQTKDGSYLITGNGKHFIICIDKDGKLRWQKTTDYTLGSGVLIGDKVQYFYCKSASDNKSKIVSVDPLTGDITATDHPNSKTVDLSNPCYNGKKLVTFLVKYNTNIIFVNELDCVTFQKASKTLEIEISEASGAYIMKAVYNSNGNYTLILRIEDKGTGFTEFLAISLDPSFNVLKKLTFNTRVYQASRVYAFPDDGFVIATVTARGEHDNDVYHVMRVDKNLNLMWESDIETLHLGVFVTSENQICAFGSDFTPNRGAYLFKLGSEDSFEVESHALSHREALEATCERIGETEHWICLDCKKTFSDAEGKNEIPSSSVYLPKTDHVIVPCDEIKPTCTENGYTGGTYCSVCKEQLTPKTVVKAKGHTEEKAEDVAATCTADGFIGAVSCKTCGEVLVEKAVIKALGHKAVTDPAVEPTKKSDGLTEGSHCSVCGVTLVAQETVEALKPSGLTVALIIALPCIAVVAAVSIMIKRKKKKA